jgi:hypothetical protein
MKIINQNKDLFCITILSIIISICIGLNFTDISHQKLNELILPLEGVFLGSLITSYTIFATLSRDLPANFKKTKSYKKIGILFLLGIFILILLILLTILLYFLENIFLFFIQIFGSILIIFIISYLLIIIHKLIYLSSK